MWGGHSKLRYALIGLMPYIFHFDLSKTVTFKFTMLQYFIALRDLHHFFVPAAVYKNFLREEYLVKRLPTELLNINIPYGAGVKGNRIMSNPLVDNNGINPWKVKGYPETRDENIKILDDYLTLCEENNIRPVMFTVPVTERFMEAFNKTLLEEYYLLVKQACQKHSNAIFIDGWKLQGFTYANFFDHTHLNIQGAAKLSAYLNDFIERLKSKDGET